MISPTSDGMVNQPGNLWTEACQVLGHHAEVGHSCIVTLKRLWQKHPLMRLRTDLPEITEDMIEVVAETWSLEQLWAIVHNDQVTTDPPRKQSVEPLIVLHWDGTDYLIDGRRRLNKWKRENNQGPHRVLVVRPKLPL